MLRQAQHERDGVIHHLKCHPDTPPNAVSAVAVEWLANDPNEALLTFVVSGADALVVPAAALRGRADDLWRTTCFEVFWRAAGGEGYVELNLSPSGHWAAYAFDGYRSGMGFHPMAVDPLIETVRDGAGFVVEADVDFSTLASEAARIGLCAVIEETNGVKSYWALAHPPGAPDFHHPDCFALELPAAERP